jgi:hypothetical protein
MATKARISEAARGERHLLQRGRRMWQNSRDGGEA